MSFAASCAIFQRWLFRPFGGEGRVNGWEVEPFRPRPLGGRGWAGAGTGGGLRAAGTCAVFVAGETPERSRRIKDEPCLCAGDRLLTEGVALLLVVRVNLKHPRQGLTRFCSLPLARVPAENCALWRRRRVGGGAGGGREVGRQLERNLFTEFICNLMVRGVMCKDVYRH